MHDEDRAVRRRVLDGLAEFEQDVGVMPGIQSTARRDALVRQFVASDRRKRFVTRLVQRDLSPSRLDPLSGKFDPLRGAIIADRKGEMDEAFWLLFLFIHFGRHRLARYQYAADVYGRLGQGDRWSWTNVTSDVDGFRAWMESNADTIRSRRGPHGFGNHRKYESLSGNSGTGAVVASYVDWVGPTRSHQSNMAAAAAAADHDPAIAFDNLYRSMSSIERFGRLARFDYLSMGGKLQLVNLRPGRAYLTGSTGPLNGARLLFDDVASSAALLDERLVTLEHYLAVGFDTIEDALCNWEKSPDTFKPFLG